MLDADDDRPSFPLRADLTFMRMLSTICCLAFNYGLFILAGEPSVLDDERLLFSQTFCSNEERMADSVFDCASGLEVSTLNSFTPRYQKDYLVDVPFAPGWLADYRKFCCKLSALLLFMYQIVQWRRGETGILFSSGQVVRTSAGPSLSGQAISWRIALATFGRTLGVPLALAITCYFQLLAPELGTTVGLLSTPLDEALAIAVSAVVAMVVDALPLLCTSRRQTMGDLVFQCYVGQTHTKEE
jgi:hypothetical protein